MSPFRGQFSPDPHLGHIGQRIPCLLLWLNPYSSPSFPACIPAFSFVSSHYLIVKSVRLLRSVFSFIVYKWNAPQYATLRRQAIIKIIELCSRQYKLLPFAKTFTCIEFARDREKKKPLVLPILRLLVVCDLKLIVIYCLPTRWVLLPSYIIPIPPLAPWLTAPTRHCFVPLSLSHMIIPPVGRPIFLSSSFLSNFQDSGVLVSSSTLRNETLCRPCSPRLYRFVLTSFVSGWKENVHDSEIPDPRGLSCGGRYAVNTTALPAL